ncbi:PREDICTED: elongation of very long chain fatty acids protein 4-like isoform X2 [Amphimedon queenslandica]|uniref:Elongation of very long chain fatty acids protein n=1 Tax=Amphimedon queenslandica TaxID=400682 RepID=A0A1X7U8J7_AMPQE|nr:PREDICTED: elongation of very long chain fatty acids protein 4-like isoform X2 [Amphimedon queenslandica]|eukprot:XP_011405756.2 PREDICTED: elongation of very long chain fatty acids protein 4-like isoform X2 [Amphimedon queenslandica]
MAASTSLRDELGKLMRVFDDPKGFYKDVIESSDPRVSEWLWMGSPLPTLCLIILYLGMVYSGPKIMKNRAPFDMKALLFVFNAFIVVLNFWMLWEMTFGMIDAGYNFICTPMRYSYHPAQLRIANAIWWYYFSKFIEFSDTLFFILRKKNDQVTFLHVYHHASMFFLWWIGVKWVAGGQSVLGAWINCLVHVVMYSYYALSALGPALKPYLWWKHHITHLQLIQFSLAIIHCMHSIYIDCNFPKWMHYTLLAYATSFIILFTNFYIHAYIKGKRRGGGGGKKEQVVSQLANGSVRVEDKKKR